MPNPEQPAPVDLTDFDLAGFIAGTVVPSRVIPVSNDRDLGAQVAAAEQALAALERRQDGHEDAGTRPRRRLGQATTSDVEQARRDLEGLKAKAARSLVYVRVEGIMDTAVKAQRDKDGKALGGTVHDFHLATIALTGRVHLSDPRVDVGARGQVMTAQQWDDFQHAIGLMQWERILLAMAEVMSAGVTPDFSQPASPSPVGGVSSAS